MRSSNWLRGWLSGLVAVVLVAGVVAGVEASDQQMEQQADTFEQQLDEAAQAKGSEMAEEDIDQARKWLEDARVLLAKGEENAAGQRLRRVKLSLELIDALNKAGAMEKIADEQEATFYRAREEKLPQLEDEIEQLEEQKSELEDEIEKLRR